MCEWLVFVCVYYVLRLVVEMFCVGFGWIWFDVGCMLGDDWCGICY